MNNVIAAKAEGSCSSMDEGMSYRHDKDAQLDTYAVSPGMKITIIASKGPEAHTLEDGGIAHVKTCADPNGDTYDGGQAKKSDEFCYGQNYYDVALDGHTITEMTELYGS